MSNPGIAPTAQVARWIRAWRVSESPRARLVCMPHAGGSASFFRDWRDHLPSDIDLLAVQYPGREERFSESVAVTMVELAEGAVAALQRYADRPLILFGHSMGATLAYEVARRLEALGTVPLRVFVSAHPPPHRQRESELHRLGDQALLDDVQALSGGSSSPLANAEARALFMPMLRGDYRAIETYRCMSMVKLQAPLDVLRATGDSSLDDCEARAWQEVTLCASKVLQFGGGHFYLVAQREHVIARLVARINSESVEEETP